MKMILLSIATLLTASSLYSQAYPDPEFTNELYYLQKNNGKYNIIRLEKTASVMQVKTKLAGFGGQEAEYPLDGSSASVRIPASSNPSFIVSTGKETKGIGSLNTDSIMRANGVDPVLLQQTTGHATDPETKYTLYKAEQRGAQRVILFQKSHSGPFAKKGKVGDKYTFSVKKIRSGYWELIPDKTLPPGEYVFSAYDPASSSAKGPGSLLFAFGID